MELEFLRSPAFWATVVVAYVIPKVSKPIDFVLRSAWVFLVDRFPSVLRTMFRGRRAKKLRSIRMARWSDVAIGYEIAKSSSWFLVFCGITAVYFLLLFVGPLSDIFKINFWFGFSLTAPIYVFEIIWLGQDQKVKTLIELNSKLRKARLKRMRRTGK